MTVFAGGAWLIAAQCDCASGAHPAACVLSALAALEAVVTGAWRLWSGDPVAEEIARFGEVIGAEDEPAGPIASIDRG